jgi:hypothetical protein
MIATIASALGLDPVKRADSALIKAREQLAAATREREQLVGEEAAAAEAFHKGGTDKLADALQRLQLRRQRAERLEEEARAAVSAAEREASSAGAEAAAQTALARLAAGVQEEADAAAVLARLNDALLAAVEKMATAIERGAATATERDQRHATASAAVRELTALDPARAAPMEATLRERAANVASRSAASARILVLARVAASLDKLSAAAAARVRTLVGEQAAAARLVGAAPLPAGAADAFLEREATPSPTWAWVNRWLALAFGALPPRPVVAPVEPVTIVQASWPSLTGHALNDAERLDARVKALDLILTQAGEHDGANALLAEYLNASAPAREARQRAQHEQRVRDFEAYRAQQPGRPIPDVTAGLARHVPALGMVASPGEVPFGVPEETIDPLPPEAA